MNEMLFAQAERERERESSQGSSRTVAVRIIKLPP
jgi:hypothetical protein